MMSLEMSKNVSSMWRIMKLQLLKTPEAKLSEFRGSPTTAAANSHGLSQLAEEREQSKLTVEKMHREASRRDAEITQAVDETSAGSI